MVLGSNGPGFKLRQYKSLQSLPWGQKVTGVKWPWGQIVLFSSLLAGVKWYRGSNCPGVKWPWDQIAGVKLPGVFLRGSNVL